MPDASQTILSVKDLHSHYGESHILHGMTFDVPRGEVVTLLGRNGVGKTTTMRSIMGVVRQRRGSIVYDGTETIALAANQIARLGVAYCPEERAIFSSLNVTENLLLPPVVRPGGMTLEEVYELFPRLKERGNSQGTKLSGGEQQMLAIARILRTGAQLFLLDEPTEGLARCVDDEPLVSDVAGFCRKGFHVKWLIRKCLVAPAHTSLLYRLLLPRAAR